MRNLKIYCVGSPTTANWMRGSVCNSMHKADVVVFPGGADVNPKMYGEAVNPSTRWNDQLDMEETLEFNQAMQLGKKMIGICRGAQLLCVKAGGKLVQHQSNGWIHHKVFTFDGRIIRVSSDHHQAMYPWGMAAGYEVLGWSIGLSEYHQGATLKDEMVIGKVPMNMEVEMAFFPGINALCFQPHPEWQYPNISNQALDKEAIDYYRILMDRFMSGDKFKEASDAYSIRKEALA